MTRVAVMGLGAMGSRMAARLIEGGREVVAYNRTPGRAHALEQAGATVVATPREAAAGAEVAIAMVSDDEASRAVWTDPDTGALEALSQNALAIESSTVTPGWARELAGAAAQRGVAFLEAPVSGSRPQADAGQLIFFVGGKEGDLARARPTLDLMGADIHLVGPVGQAATLKLAVNALLGIQVAALGELAPFLGAAGLDEARALDILCATAVASPAAKGAVGQIKARSFAPLFPVALMAKDLRYAGEVAAAVDASLPVTEAAARVFGEALDSGLGDENMSGVIRLHLDRNA